jgi:dTDP-4-dehydrorhamnose reductase
MATPSQRRLLLTGPSGLLGATIVDSWADRWDIIAFSGRHRMARGVVEDVPVRLETPSSLLPLVVRARPEVVVHCAAWTDLDACETNPALARTIHRDATAALAEGAARVSAAFVYISTDSLFSRVPGPHREDDPIDPRSVYAKTKREGEEVALGVCPAALIVRTCIVGWNAQPKTSLVEWLVRELGAGRSVKGFTDVAFTPIATTTFAKALERVVDLEARGILHVGGGECVSKYEFAREVAEAFELPRELVSASSIADEKLVAPRPRAPCLDSSRYAALTGDRPPTVDETLTELRRLRREGFCDRLRSSILG